MRTVIEQRSSRLKFNAQKVVRLLAETQQQALVALNLLLQLQQSKQQRFGRRWATGHVNVDGDDAVAAAHNWERGRLERDGTTSIGQHRRHVPE